MKRPQAIESETSKGVCECRIHRPTPSNKHSSFDYCTQAIIHHAFDNSYCRGNGIKSPALHLLSGYYTYFRFSGAAYESNSHHLCLPQYVPAEVVSPLKMLVMSGNKTRIRPVSATIGECRSAYRVVFSTRTYQENHVPPALYEIEFQDRDLSSTTLSSWRYGLSFLDS